MKGYINDIIVHFKTFTNYMIYLWRVFVLCTVYNISIKPTKTFLGYTEINLLEQQVNLIGLFTTKSKLKIIAKIKFPSTLVKLKIFLRMIGYLHKFILRYAAITKLLQDMKTSCLKNAPVKGQK